MEGAGEGESKDLRVPVVAAGLLLLATLVGVVALSSGSSKDQVVAAPARCLSLWNGDSKALVYGSHNYYGHGYRQAEVMYVDRAGNAVRHGSCAVVFPSAALDLERVAAAETYLRRRWLPLSKAAQIDAVRLAELQVEAIAGANVALRPDGTLRSF